VHLKYERGPRVLEANITVNALSVAQGSFSVTASTPFRFLRDLSINGNWQNGQGSVTYVRNGVTHSFSGAFEIVAEQKKC